MFAEIDVTSLDVDQRIVNLSNVTYQNNAKLDFVLYKMAMYNFYKKGMFLTLQQGLCKMMTKESGVFLHFRILFLS